MGAAKEFIGQAINEMFIKKEAPNKRVLPSISNMKIVSFSLVEIQLNPILYISLQSNSTMTLGFHS